MAKKRSSSTKFLLIAGLAAAAVLLYTKFRTLVNLNFIAQDVSLGGGGLVLTLGVQNPTSNDLQLQSLVGTVKLNGSPIANINQFQPYTIRGNAQTNVPINISPDIFGQVSQVLATFFQGTGPTQQIALDGTANVGGSLVPINVVF